MMALVVRRTWLTGEEFLPGLTLSQLLPGPTVSNLSVFLGNSLNGPAGAALALLAVLLPGALAILSWSWASCTSSTASAPLWSRPSGGWVRPWAVAVERSLAPLAIGLMAAGVYTVARSAVTDWPTAILAAGAGIILAKRWFPAAAAVLAASALGWLLGL
jgi:chromate transport protein ChrA